MFLGLTFEKVLLILAIGALLVGPERLPALAAQLAALTKRVRRLGQAAKDRVEEELGEEFAEVDWHTLVPRRYDPRRIVLDALREPDQETTRRPSEAGLLAARRPPVRISPPGADADAPTGPGPGEAGADGADVERELNVAYRSGRFLACS